MKNPIFYLVTGISSGIGLQLAKQLMSEPNVHIITGVRSKASEEKLNEEFFGSVNLHIFSLDLSIQKSVRDFAERVIQFLGGDKLNGLALNAGIQRTAARDTTVDGLDDTIAANYVGHFALFHFLREHLDVDAKIVSTASGTQDPTLKLATSFGFRGGIFTSPELVLSGDLGVDGSEKQLSMDRYATSKLCNIMFTRELAKRTAESPDNIKFIAFDPGLMPGTELARQNPAGLKFAWHHVLPKLQPVFALFGLGVSLPKLSAKTLKKLLTGEISANSGDYIEFTTKFAPESEIASDAEKCKALYDYTVSYLESKVTSSRSSV